MSSLASRGFYMQPDLMPFQDIEDTEKKFFF